MKEQEALALAYAHAQLVQAMQFEKFIDDSKAPRKIQEMDFLAEEYALALEYYSTFSTDEKISEQ